ncbi:5800_t:CDS:2 [Ambispora gerdemannii]|uniref:5800_t:CDS:1 n=1 Tax=Ambispora gerdemannii TaxID=144530 RepID=A0A9N9GKI7_9GLOM|nr:5800_t:CDS:2 [Ambispora gerdemannii]
MVGDFQNGLNDYVENQRNNSDKAQLRSQISSLEQNLNKTPTQQADLTKKKEKLQELEKALTKSLPLSTQISILEREIKSLASKSTRTQVEEALLTSKKKQLAELLKKQNNSDANSTKPSDKTAFYIGLGMGGVFLILDKYLDYDLAYYCKSKQLAPAEVKDSLKYRYKLAQELQSTQAYLDFFYPLTNRSKIKKLDFIEKDLTGDLNLTGFDNLTELDCFRSNLTNLDLSDCSSLTKLDCSDNKLTNLNFINTLPCPEKLTNLNINSNKITSNLTPLSKLVNLQALNLFNNSSLATSLAPLQHCLKLEGLGISSTNLTPDLQYLPLTSHPELMQQAGKKKVVDNNDYRQSELKTVITTPKYLTEHSKSTTEPVTTSEQAITQKLPFRLYNIEKNKIEKTEGKVAIEACKQLGINYLWMDQLCINQANTKESIEEKNQEIPKMRQYYGNASAALIAIDDNVKEE